VLELGEFLAGRRQSVLTFAGYSASGYQDPAAMLAFAAAALDARSPASTLVNIGATPLGIGAVYPMARQRGFATIGIVSSLARTERVTLSPFVDEVFYIEDSVWGGLLPGSPRLSATSTAVVAHSREFVAIGGGVIAAAELCAARAAVRRSVRQERSDDHGRRPAARTGRTAGLEADRRAGSDNDKCRRHQRRRRHRRRLHRARSHKSRVCAAQR
jgi:hypothetical protein